MAEIPNWLKTLEKTRNRAFSFISDAIGSNELTSDFWENLEAGFIQSDMDVKQSELFVKNIQELAKTRGVIQTKDVKPIIQEVLEKSLDLNPGSPNLSIPAVVLVVGVNGSGKTTTLVKLAGKLKDTNKQVLLVAADTYRAAAIDQLQEWADRINIPVISGQQGADPGAVVFDAIQSAVSRNIDFVLIDTAGRLHTKYNLMEELKKIAKVTSKALSSLPYQIFLVIDASNGQNAIQQAKQFSQSIPITGIILSKLDTSAKGGMVFSIYQELHLPIFYVGTGEKIEDIAIFDPHSFIQGFIHY
jgi:fused signal recognition particle receptor